MNRKQKSILKNRNAELYVQVISSNSIIIHILYLKAKMLLKK